MQCRYCGTDNPDSVRMCVSCSKPLPATGARNARGKAGFMYVGHEKHAGPFLPQIGANTRVNTLRRTRRLTGTTLPKSTTSTNPEAPRGHAQADTAQRGHPGAGGGAGDVLHQSAQDRTEPSWSDATESSWMRSHETTMHGESRVLPPSRKRKVLRAMLMAGIFVVGAGAGLIGAWWISNPSAISFITGPEKPPVNPVVAIRKPADDGRGGSVRGINPSELPYDGAAPPEPVEPAAPVPPQVRADSRPSAPVAAPSKSKRLQPAPVAESSGASAEVPVMEESGRAAEEAAGTVDPGASRQPIPDEETQESVRETRKSAPREVVTPARSVAKAANRVKDDDDNKLTVAPKRTAPAKSTKDREIERIRQQAEEELKKKSERGRQIGRSRANNGVTAKASQRRQEAASARKAGERSVKVSLARCEHASNFIRREQCKWRICGGSWGKNGCPYYPPHVSNVY